MIFVQQITLGSGRDPTIWNIYMSVMSAVNILSALSADRRQFLEFVM